MTSGGKRLGAGRKPHPDKLVKMTIRITQGQKASLPEKGKNAFIRAAIDWKLADACCTTPGKEKCEQCQEIGSANPCNH